MTLKRTPFYDFHVAAGGKIVPFAGYEMPVQYPTGITKEHEAVRTGVGVFDVSHMGEFEVTGRERNDFVNRMTSNDVSTLDIGQAQYSAILNDQGTVVDDCIVYQFGDKLMMVVNASNIEKDWAHISSRRSGDVRLRNISDEVSLLAVQGPKAETLLRSLTQVPLHDIGYYHFKVGDIAGVQCFVSRTGYTGEDGFELYFRNRDAGVMWKALVEAGGATPIGLGARDSLRLEMGYALYGNDIDDTINPYEAGLGWIVKLNKAEPFVGQEALRAIKEKGVTRKLVGFRMIDRGAIPRHGYDVYLRDTKIDVVRSGGFSPSLKEGIGTTFLPTHSVEPGTRFQVDSRGKRIEAEVVRMPFYRQGSARKAKASKA
ncbi:MAG: glycine cleavage system aminomethyltransferase GcvT [Gemmatimonadetes bacterium]|nr:glycine cleavage system aminomethyltransferase GcvT [Gemmatimonadota bacterium]